MDFLKIQVREVAKNLTILKSRIVWIKNPLKDIHDYGYDCPDNICV